MQSACFCINDDPGLLHIDDLFDFSADFEEIEIAHDEELQFPLDPMAEEPDYWSSDQAVAGKGYQGLALKLLSRRAGYGTIYIGESFEVCVLEAIIRDSGIGLEGAAIPISESELSQWSIAELRPSKSMRLLDLTGGGAVAFQIPTDAIRAKDHSLGQAWSEAIYNHSDAPDGLLFSSRLNKQTNAAVFSRALEELDVIGMQRMIDMEDELAEFLDKYKIALVP